MATLLQRACTLEPQQYNTKPSVAAVWGRQILDIPNDSGTAEARKAYFSLARLMHPDKNSECEPMRRCASKAFQLLQQAAQAIQQEAEELEGVQAHCAQGEGSGWVYASAEERWWEQDTTRPDGPDGRESPTSSSVASIFAAYDSDELRIQLRDLQQKLMSHLASQDGLGAKAVRVEMVGLKSELGRRSRKEKKAGTKVDFDSGGGFIPSAYTIDPERKCVGLKRSRNEI
eukprot:CAMPEP_0196599814 /NCGR_PEP_ID=MMETSP1081-20130531/95055_1 /TAXON_ID=36882 /ORGANISM="Pyramimonas amylifera, Strain CCMP720" /LENGTH=229 /DNA_ID=CAMNT_0041925607 /DNA_START=718 /DNA_END=1407 /DNA_ORIENTATION=+